ncbi:MAG: hypothetical protein ACYCU7_01385 [Acidimicrobiales bacterium]
MTTSSAPTAELPVIGPLVEVPAHPAPPAPPALGEAVLTVPDAAETVPCRADLRAERRLARRYRRIHAAAGLAVLLCTLGATVAVLDVLH